MKCNCDKVKLMKVNTTGCLEIAGSEAGQGSRKWTHGKVTCFDHLAQALQENNILHVPANDLLRHSVCWSNHA